MKTIFFSGLFVLLFQNSVCAQYYTFTTFQEEYSVITIPDEVCGIPEWDDGQYYRTLPFTFKFFNRSQTFVLIDCDGKAVFEYFMPEDFMIHALGGDIMGTTDSNSTVSLKLVTIGANRVYQMQWRNAAFVESPADFVNFQIWLYENTNVIEIRYGNSSITADPADIFTSGAPMAGVRSDSVAFYLANDPASPVMTANPGELNSVPDSGTVYRFTPSAVNYLGINNFPGPGVPLFRLFPNPASDYFSIGYTGSSEVSAEFILYDILGKEILRQPTVLARSVNHSLDVSTLKRGVYFYKLESANGTFNGKLILHE